MVLLGGGMFFIIAVVGVFEGGVGLDVGNKAGPHKRAPTEFSVGGGA